MPAAPSRRTAPKKKSNALLYGCLAGVCVFLLVVCLVIGGIYWAINRANDVVK